jgi:DNA-binding SARP family transcriptional activator/Tfp pilus assembly protein PilF
VDILLLGPVQARVDDQPINIGVRRQRFVLAVLALQPNRLVTVERLVDLCWPDDPPRTARRVIHTQISQLRATLSRNGAARDGISIHGGSGYALKCDPDRIDAHRFAALHAQARAAGGDDYTRVALLDQALDLWRGAAMADAAPDHTRARLCGHLEQARLDAAEDRLEALLRLGQQQDVVNEASQLVGEHPHRHRLTATLVLALHRAGRTAEALATYRHTRQRLADELGIDPPAELQELEIAILRNDPALAAPTNPETVARYTSTAAPMPVPRQLPADTAAFTGRTTELDHLLTLLPDQDQPPATVVISAIDGMAGVGKTALAVHAAHQLADRYPDGQLFIDLHGYTPSADPVEAAEALDHLLRALGVPGAQIPTSLDQQAALYRTRLADQRMLILLDNVATETQLAPLLPGSPGPLVLVTSRRRLTGLDYTHSLSLDALPIPDAVELFTRVIGENRLGSQAPERLVELVELCGRLPLALRIAAARLRAHPTWHLSDLVRRLRDTQHRLGELETGQRSVTAALDLSYQHLNPDQQRTYRLLGATPGPNIDPYATAALLNSTVAHAGRMLNQLHDAHLLQEPAPGRYRSHDLIRAHAARTATSSETELGERLDRLLDYYRHTAAAAMNAAYPYQREARPQVPPAHTACPDLTDPAAALDWLRTDLPNLLAAAQYAAEHDRPAHVMHLSTILQRYLRSCGPYHGAETLHNQALVTARAAGHQTGQIEALTGLGWVNLRQGRYQQAAKYLRQILDTARATGHQSGELDAHIGLGWIHLWRGRYSAAAENFRQALQLARLTNHRADETRALNGLGDTLRQQGRYEKATRRYQQALQLASSADHHPGRLAALNGLGWAHLHRRRHEHAAENFQKAFQLARATSHRPGELVALSGLGQTRLRQNRCAEAAEHYRQLLTLATEAGERNGQFEAHQGLGRLRHSIGEATGAIVHHAQALTLARDLDQPLDQARAHAGLGRAHHAMQRHDQARNHWQQALDILTHLGVDRTDDEEITTAAIRDHLAGLDPTSGKTKAAIATQVDSGRSIRGIA